LGHDLCNRVFPATLIHILCLFGMVGQIPRTINVSFLNIIIVPFGENTNSQKSQARLGTAEHRKRVQILDSLETDRPLASESRET
jgi:hypothetical protein